MKFALMDSTVTQLEYWEKFNFVKLVTVTEMLTKMQLETVTEQVESA